jgi:Xaa-Pro dipeptidase
MSVSPERRLPFTESEFERRLFRVRQAAETRGLDALVINRPENIYYLTGYHSLGYFAYQVLIVPVESEPWLVVRYGERSNVWGRSWLQRMECYRDTDDPIEVTRRTLSRVKVRRIGVEMTSWFLTPALCARLVAAVSPNPVEDCSGLVERERAVKSAEELYYVRAAARVSSVAVEAGI